MAADVYANGREVACKAASGKSVAAFPDACWSPPVPPPTGAPIPYPNTAFARDTAQGTRTVSIRGQEAMVKNKSYFRRSTGDEAATPTLQKGIVSRQIRGKCYFTSWSMNVKFEGLNVDRHLDLTTHNHGSPIANTPPFPYTDRMSALGAKGCEAQKAKVEEACKNDEDRECPTTKKFETYKGLAEIKRRPTPLKNKIENWKEQKDRAGDVMGELKDLLKEAKGQLKDAVENHSKNPISKADAKVERMKEKLGAARKKSDKEAASASLRNAIKERREAKKNKKDKSRYDKSRQEVRDARQEVDRLTRRIETKDERLTELKENLKELVPVHQAAAAEAADIAEEHKEAQSTWRKGATGFAFAIDRNPCQRALRCVLSPYNPSKCCPGQTGHHLVPTGSFFHRGRGQRKKVKDSEDTYQTSAPVLGTEKYKADDAPCICVEGQSSRLGTHGLMHTIQGYKDRQNITPGHIELNLTEYQERVKRHAGGKEKPPKLSSSYQVDRMDEKGNPVKITAGKSPADTTTYAKAKASGIAAVQEVFPDSGCDPVCLAAQLDAYHNACGVQDDTVVRSIVAGSLEDTAERIMTDDLAAEIKGSAEKSIEWRRQKLGFLPAPSGKPRRRGLPKGGQR